MSDRHRALSLLLMYHLTALGLAALPAPDRLTLVEPGAPPQVDVIAAYLTPPLGRAASWVARVQSAMFAWSTPLVWITRPYIDAGLKQNWSMFANPVTDRNYLRLDYYVETVQSRWVAHELVFPLEREDRVRLLHDFRDKAVVSAIESFFLMRREGTPGAENDFKPLVRYFKSQYHDKHLLGGERIMRTDVWYGTAAIAPRGANRDPDASASRLEALSRYYDGTDQEAFAGARYPRLDSEEREADIVWTLAYIE